MLEQELAIAIARRKNQLSVQSCSSTARTVDTVCIHDEHSESLVRVNDTISHPSQCQAHKAARWRRIVSSPLLDFLAMGNRQLNSEWELIQRLAYASQTTQDAQFVQLIYTARLRKYKHATEHALTRQRLVEEFGLGDNPDVLFSFANSLYANYQFADCFNIISRSVLISLEIIL
jgi:hypothetical protein